ncbi:hypothetical protein BC936DRAFT_142768 [Jimgerdemannia flammicorona]|uniref:Uncharacterized protein n=1 Tax=Jimgerdemannia flammicorona TaxID=994334 RepID=A0A433DES9_9FUNG|nr:hypothetical protein BC936DRAFT_142768 [Jimgerdemannia flammicorona]
MTSKSRKPNLLTTGVEVAVQEVAVRKVAVQEVVVQEVAVQKVAVQKVVVQEVAVQEVAVQEVAVQEVAVQEVAVQEVGVQEDSASLPTKAPPSALLQTMAPDADDGFVIPFLTETSIQGGIDAGGARSHRSRTGTHHNMRKDKALEHLGSEFILDNVSVILTHLNSTQAALHILFELTPSLHSTAPKTIMKVPSIIAVVALFVAANAAPVDDTAPVTPVEDVAPVAPFEEAALTKPNSTSSI